MELIGIIKKIGDVETFGTGFQKRELVIVTEEQYPQPIAIDFLQGNVDLPEVHQENSKVKVHINLRGREWTSPTGEVNYFNSIIGWRIEKQ